MFETEEQARTAFAEIEHNYPQVRQKIGDALASVALIHAHGRQSEAEDDGHFDLHEYEQVDLSTVAYLIGPL